MPNERYAVIDIGSNSVKLLIAERHADGRFEPVIDTSRTTRLGEGIQARRLGEEAMRRTLDALAEYRSLCKEYGAAQIAAVGTSALRDAANQDEFISRAAELGIVVEAISGQEEARLSFAAVRKDERWRTAENLLVVDIGGGSTEVIVNAGNAVGERVSLPLGAVRLTEACLHSDPPTVQEMADASHKAGEALKGLRLPPVNYTAVGVGGTFTNMAAVRFGLSGPDRAQVHGATLTLADVQAEAELFGGKTVEERKQIPGLDPSRADIILGGAIVLGKVLQAARLEEISVSSRGLRWGLMYDRFGG
jgi:exopolyphosphatase/guanosine-5'-triphosphate,3'-diphosphate pyrophosphatase